MAGFRDRLKKLWPSFTSAAQKSRQADEIDTLYQNFCRIEAALKRLEQEMLPMPEENTFFHSHPPKEKGTAWDVQEEDTKAWSAGGVLLDAFAKQGWLTTIDEAQDPVLIDTLQMLRMYSQGSARNFRAFVKAYQTEKTPKQEAIDFILQYNGDIDQAVKTLEATTPKDVTQFSIFPGLSRKNKKTGPGAAP